MILLAHPFGNANVRAVLSAMHDASLLARYITALGWADTSSWLGLFPHALRANLMRRGDNLPGSKFRVDPLREVLRLVAAKVPAAGRLTEHERGWASIDAIWQSVDRTAARYLRANAGPENIRAAYCYEDCALETFRAAKEQGVRCVYDLPIAYFETAQKLLKEEAERYPDWEPTLVGTRDSAEKLARKAQELELAELVVCPSAFVFDSLPKHARTSKRGLVVPFGSPSVDVQQPRSDTADRPLRVLFAGSMTQRKGLADLFEAMKLLKSQTVELVVLGSLLRPLEWYRDRFRHFTYEPPRPHPEVLRLMRSCDVFVLPSIVEGRALVQQEAMACGLPLIATKNAGGDDLIDEEKTGFLVPIRSPEAIAEKISWCAANRGSISGMGIAAQRRAAELTWRGYGEKVLAAVRSLTGT